MCQAFEGESNYLYAREKEEREKETLEWKIENGLICSQCKEVENDQPTGFTWWCDECCSNTES